MGFFTRSETAHLVALPGGAIAGSATLLAIEIPDPRDWGYLQLGLQSSMALLFAAIPYLCIAVPACKIIERLTADAIVKAALLTTGGAGAAWIISEAILPMLASWFVPVGLWTGLILGVMRRDITRENAGEPE